MSNSLYISASNNLNIYSGSSGTAVKGYSYISGTTVYGGETIG